LGDKRGRRFRPFSFTSGVHFGYYSKPLRRRVCDFGADHAFAVASQKMKEHYGIDIVPDMVRKITECHAEEIEVKDKEGFFLGDSKPKPIVIGEMDGSMVPIVEIEEKPKKKGKKKDRRKSRKLKYREARLSMAFSPGSRERQFEGTFANTETAGKQLKMCVNRVGADRKTEVYCIGDGATWIANQIEEQFGAKGHYLVDFYHVCEYLAEAARNISDLEDPKGWTKRQKSRLKQNKIEAVLAELKPHIEKQIGDEEKTPIVDCYRYIDNRRNNQLDYKTAIEKGLPIGSGEIESAHRYVIQKRLKIAGAWWKERNAEKMLALRVCRANNDWDQYWTKVAA